MGESRLGVPVCPVEFSRSPETKGHRKQAVVERPENMFPFASDCQAGIPESQFNIEDQIPSQTTCWTRAHGECVCGKRTSTASVKQCHLLATSRPTAGAAWVCTLASDAYAAWAHLFFGRYHMSDLDKIGGIPVVMRESHTNRELDVKRVAYCSFFFP